MLKTIVWQPNKLILLNKDNLQTATLLKVTLLHGCFSHFLNFINDNNSRKVSHMIKQVATKWTLLRY